MKFIHRILRKTQIGLSIILIQLTQMYLQDQTDAAWIHIYL